MFGQLKLPRFPVDVLERVLIDGRLLCEEVLPRWDELFLYHVGYRAAGWKMQGKGEFAAWFSNGLKRSPWGTAEARTFVIEGMDDVGRMEAKVEEILTQVLVESCALGFWVNLTISSGVKDGALWFEVNHADGVGRHRLSLGVGDEEPREAISLSLEVYDAVEAAVQMFGPMLAALSFGRATVGVMAPSRPTKVPVSLQLFTEECDGQRNGQPGEMSIGAALIEVAKLAERTSPNIILG